MCMTIVYLCGVPTVDHCKLFKSLVSHVYFPGYLTLMSVSRSVIFINCVY